jgi:hypothetical protein
LARAYQKLFRSLVQRCGGGLALAALVLQLGLSFGHFHAQDFHAYGFAEQQTVGGWNGRAIAQASLERPSKLADDDDQCPICFSSFLLASSFIPDAPRPVVPVDFRNVGGAVPRTDHLAFPGYRAAFQPRGPPVA